MTASRTPLSRHQDRLIAVIRQRRAMRLHDDLAQAQAEIRSLRAEKTQLRKQITALRRQLEASS